MSGDAFPAGDRAEVRFLVAATRLGAALTLCVSLAGAIYYLRTWDVAGRPLLLGLSGAFAGASLLLLLWPITRLVGGRHRTAFFAAWSFVSVAGMGLCLHLDRAAVAPPTFGLLLPLAFAGLMYPLRGAVAVALLDFAVFVAVNLGHPHRADDLLFPSSIFACMAVLCVWTAWWEARQRSELARLSLTEPLTGCLNRRGFAARVDRALAEGGRFALVALDLDDFKSVNDSQGHVAGDALLCDVARALRSVVRPTDAVGRLGGDEFAVLLPGAGREGAARLVDRASLALSLTAPASLGSAVFPEDGDTADALFRRADDAVYAAKARRPGRRGRGRIEAVAAGAIPARAPARP